MITTSKFIAVMDRGTRIPLIAFKMSPDGLKEHVMFCTHGFGVLPHEYTFFYDVNSGKCSYDPYKIGDAYTLTPACKYIHDHWNEIESGSLVDAQYLRGETSEPRDWEREYL